MKDEAVVIVEKSTQRRDMKAPKRPLFFFCSAKGRTGGKGEREGKKLRAESGFERGLEGFGSKDGASQV